MNNIVVSFMNLVSQSLESTYVDKLMDCNMHDPQCRHKILSNTSYVYNYSTYIKEATTILCYLSLAFQFLAQGECTTGQPHLGLLVSPVWEQWPGSTSLGRSLRCPHRPQWASGKHLSQRRDGATRREQ